MIYIKEIQFISYEWVFEILFSRKQRYARALPQELHLLPQLLGDFGELNLYKKVSGRCIIMFEAILKLALRSKSI